LPGAGPGAGAGDGAEALPRLIATRSTLQAKARRKPGLRYSGSKSPVLEAMNKPLRLGALCLAFALPLAASAQSFRGKPFLAVQGHAETRVKPDIFPIDVTISDTSMDAGKSQVLVEDLSKSVLDSAQKLRLADADIEVGNLSVSPQSEWDDDHEKETFLGNEYERRLRLRFHDLQSLRTFISTLPEGKNVQLQTRPFEFSGARELQRKLRRQAIEDAQRGAADMAGAVGKRLVELHNISDRAQSTNYSASGYSNLDSIAAVALLAPGSVRRRADIVLREGEIQVSADAFLVYVIGD
jgi:uncharacterized protein YggE